MDVKLRTRVKSITLESDDSGHELEKCVLTLADKSSVISSAYIVVDFTDNGRGALHVGQQLELSVSIEIPPNRSR
jgi:hypothetical protein